MDRYKFRIPSEPSVMRLTGTDSMPRATMMRERDTALPASDPRWVLAIRIASMLSVSERKPRVWSEFSDRLRVRRFAEHLGFAPHEADAIGVIVLDAASGGYPPVPALQDWRVIDQLSRVPAPVGRRHRGSPAADAAVIAIGSAVLVIAFVMLFTQAM